MKPLSDAYIAITPSVYYIFSTDAQVLLALQRMSQKALGNAARANAAALAL